MGLFDFIKKATSQIQQNSTPVGVKSTVSAEDKKYYRPDSYYTPKAHEGTVFEKNVLSFDDHKKRSIPSKNGLYVPEILLLEYCSNGAYPGPKNGYPGFWWFEYGIRDVGAVLKSLEERNFIRWASISNSVMRLTIPNLKEILEKYNLSVSGKKAELVERIISSISEEQLVALNLERKYELTDSGKVELAENQYVPYLHRHKYMSVWEMNHYLNNDNPSRLGYRDILWREFNKQSGEHFQNCDFGLYRSTRLYMHDFLMEESKYKIALHMLVEVASFDLSGLGNGDKPVSSDKTWRELRYQSKLVNLFFDDEQEVIIPPGIINYFKKLYELLGMPENEFKNYIYEEFSKIKIHDRVFLHDECANIVLASLGLEERKIINSKKVAETRLKKLLSL